jgi:hypothetical protein
MRRYLLSLLAMVVFGAVTTGYAETCDAGHGCRVTCKDGCSAVYNEDTGGCSTACGQQARELAKKYEKRKTQKLATKKDPMTVVVKGLKDDTSQEKPNK